MSGAESSSQPRDPISPKCAAPARTPGGARVPGRSEMFMWAAKNATKNNAMQPNATFSTSHDLLEKQTHAFLQIAEFNSIHRPQRLSVIDLTPASPSIARLDLTNVLEM
jgi:hypothetical protein